MNALDLMDDHIRAAAITLSGEEDFKAPVAQARATAFASPP